MEVDNRDDLVRLVDAARAAGDTAEVERLEAEVKRLRLKFGRRQVSGDLAMDIPEIVWEPMVAKLQTFQQWQKPN